MNDFLSQKELKKYPAELHRAIVGLSQRQPIDGLAAEVDQHLRLSNPDLVGDVTVPFALLSRSALQASTFAAGGALIADEVFPPLPLLRPASTCLKAGAQLVTGLRANSTIPSEAQEVTMTWHVEGDTISETESTFNAVALTPKRLSGLTSITRQLDLQTGGVILDFVLASLAKGVAAAFDRAALQGDGTFGIPIGVFSLSGTQAITFSTTATWANAVAFERKIADANADTDAMSFIASPDTKERWRNLARFASGGRALWEGSLCADRPAQTSSNVPSGSIVGGDFTKLLFATWGQEMPLGLLVDPYTSKKTETIEILASLYGDVAFTKPAVFSVNSGSAIQ